MMKIYRIQHAGASRHVVERDGTHRLLDGDLFGAYHEGAEVSPDLPRLPPVLPSKIVCVGLNYRDHAIEQNKPLPAEPMIFIKPSTAVVGPGEAIRVPPVGRVDLEAELGVVIGRVAARVPASRAHEYVLGAIGVNDVSARVLQQKDGQYTRAKGFDTFAPIGPAIAAGLDTRDLRVRGYVNDELRQDSRTRELIFPVAALVEFISYVMTLQPGDIISTGTPAGVGPIRPGDTVTVDVEGVGALTNPVTARD